MDTYNHTLVDAAVADAVGADRAGRGYAEPAPPVPAETGTYYDYNQRYDRELPNARRDAEMQRAMNTVPAQDYVPYSSTSGGGGIGQLIGQKGFCTGDSHYYACKHEQICTCGKTGRITVAPGL